MSQIAASTAGAIRAYLEGETFGIPWYRDRAPHNKGDGTPQDPPFGIVVDSISDVPERTGDMLYKRTTEQVQIDIYEPIVNDDGTRGESYTLAKDVLRSLSGAQITDAPEHIYRVELFSRVRFRNDETNEIRTTITLNVRRAL